jgi:transcriptional regulator with XRE-family HTH domain
MGKSWFERKHANPRQRRLVAEERMVLLATEEILRLMEREGITKAALARRLGKSKAYVTQALSGGRNMTLRTLAEFAWACGYAVRGLDLARAGQAERATAAGARSRRNGRAGRAAA